MAHLPHIQVQDHDHWRWSWPWRQPLCFPFLWALWYLSLTAIDTGQEIQWRSLPPWSERQRNAAFCSGPSQPSEAACMAPELTLNFSLHITAGETSALLWLMALAQPHGQHQLAARHPLLSWLSAVLSHTCSIHANIFHVRMQVGCFHHQGVLVLAVKAAWTGLV